MGADRCILLDYVEALVGQGVVIPMPPDERRLVVYSPLVPLCLPFGLSTSPRTFTKVLIVIIVVLRTRGVKPFHFLDDILVFPNSSRLLEHSSIAHSQGAWVAGQLGEECFATHAESGIPES